MSRRILKSNGSFLTSLGRRWANRNQRLRDRRRPGRLRAGIICAAETLEDRQLLTGIPALNSLPGAEVSVYLDFDGHIESEWGTPQDWAEDRGLENWKIYPDVPTPPYDIDNNPLDFSAEQSAIVEVFERIKEDFSPFRVNVTTVEPEARKLESTIRVAIGGHQADWHDIKSAGGWALRDTFSDSELSNTVYVFQFLDDDGEPYLRPPWRLAEGASHETGHAFGLKHHTAFDESGVPVEEEDGQDSYWDGIGPQAPADAGSWVPIMGHSDANVRTTWWSNRSALFGLNRNDLVQSDMEEIAASIGQGEQGYVPDENDGTVDDATPWNPDNPIRGIIRYTNPGQGELDDADMYRVSLPASIYGNTWTIRVDVVQFGPNLDAKLEVFDRGGRLLAVDDRSDRLNAILTLGAGEYFVSVRGHGNYGDAGQYTLTAVAPSPHVPVWTEIGPPYVDMGDPMRSVEFGRSRASRRRSRQVRTTNDRRTRAESRTQRVRTARRSDTARNSANDSSSRTSGRTRLSARSRHVVATQAIETVMTSLLDESLNLSAR